MGKKSTSINEVPEVSAQDNKWAEELITSKGYELVFLGWVNRPKGKSFEKRILLITKMRIYLANAKYKIEKEIHIADIKSVESTSPDNFTLNAEGWSNTLHTPETDSLINSISTVITTAFPGMPESVRPKFTIEPSSRLRDAESDSGICGGFIDTYRVWCDYYQRPVREDIVWDVTHLFTTNNITEFNLEDFELPLPPEHLSPLFAALRYNDYFTGLIAKNIPLDPKKTLPEIGKCLSCNHTITKVILSGVGMTKDALSTLTDGINANPNTSINVIDFSKNQIDDKAMASLAQCIGGQKNGLIQINLSNCSISKNGMSQLGQAFRKNVHMTNTLSSLIIPGNQLDTDGSSSLASWLANPNKLQVLNIANSSANLETIMPALVRGCNGIRNINVSGNKLAKRTVQSLTQFLRSTDSLLSLNLNNTTLPAPDMVAIAEAIGANPYLKDFDLSVANNKFGPAGAKQTNVFATSTPNIAILNLADNDFGDEGLSTVCQSIGKSTSIVDLNLSRNFSAKPSKSRDQLVEDLIELINNECPLERLILQGNKTLSMKSDLLSFIDGLGTNDSLLSLDISGHQMGNKGGMAIGKMLQTNRKLKHLVWEDNGTTFFGFNAVANGLERNKFLKEMDLPIIDISNALKNDNATSLQKCMTRIQGLLARNQNPKTLKGGSGNTLNQFSILSSGEREHVERLKFKIKSSNRAVSGEQKAILEDAENNDSNMAAIYSIAEAHQTIMADEITAKLKELAKDIMPVVDKHFADTVSSILDTVTERYKSLDPDSIRRINTSISFGVQPLEESKVEKILANAASAEIASKANDVFASALEISTDYIYEKIIDGLVTIIDDVKNETKDRRASVALFNANDASDASDVVKKSPATPKKDKPAPPPTRGRPPPRGRGAPAGRALPGGLDPSKMLGGRGMAMPGMMGGRPPAKAAPASPSPPPTVSNNTPSPKDDKKIKKGGLFGRGKGQAPKKAPPKRPGGAPSMANAPDVKKVKKPANDTSNLKAVDQAVKAAEPTTTLTHATRDRPMVAKARRPPTRRPRAKPE